MLGPILGGFLSNPTEKYPNVFGSFQFLKNNPYFLPCFFSACFSGFGFIIGYFWLEETRFSGNILVQEEVFNNFEIRIPNELQNQKETEPLLILDEFSNQEHREISNQKVSRKAIGKTSIQVIISYSQLAFFNIIFDEVFAIWMVSPIENGNFKIFI